MAEYSAIARQTIQAGQNLILTDVPVSGMCEGIIHRDGSGIITLMSPRAARGMVRYSVSFSANVAIPADGTAATPLSLSLAIDGEPLQSSTMIVTPPAVNEFWNVSTFSIIELPAGCCFAIAVENTGTDATDVQNANLVIERGRIG